MAPPRGVQRGGLCMEMVMQMFLVAAQCGRVYAHLSISVPRRRVDMWTQL